MRGRTCGFSLVELMVAMVLGLGLIGGATAVFHGNVRSAGLGQSIATMQAGARYALDEIATALRGAGHRGCASVEATPFGVALDAPPLDAAAPLESAVYGARIGASGWTPALPAGYTPPTDRAVPVAGTDALLVQYAAGPGEPLLAAMGTPGSALQVAGTARGLEVNDLAVVADCTGADLFSIGARVAAAGAVSLTPTRSLTRRYRPDPTRPLGTPRVLPFVSVIYYVGDTGRRTAAGDAVRSLYAQTFPYDLDANPPLELVEGVDQLQLAFGMRDPASGGVRFVDAADAAYDAARATAVRVGLLMSSLERLDDGEAVRTFTLAGRPVRPAGDDTAGAAFYPDDRRLRIGFERGVTVRGRLLGGLEG